MSVQFTSNGYLVSQQIIDDLKKINCPVSIQITIDGNKEKHNKIRRTKNGELSFDTIVSNIKLLISQGIQVNCRINYTKDNVYSIADVIDEFSQLTIDDLKFLNFNLQRVWQDYGGKDLKAEEEKIMTWFQKECLSVTNSSLTSSRHCYADYENNIVVNYDGSLFKCTARDFTKNSSEGLLTSDGSIQTNSRYKNRMVLKRGGKICYECRIYPICHANCSQYALENEDKIKNDICLLHYSEEDKTRRIIEQLNSRINAANSQL